MTASPDLDAGLDDLDARLMDTARLSSAFGAELARLRGAMGGATQDLGHLEKGLASGLRRAIDGLVVDGDRLSDALRTVGRAMVQTVYDAAMKPVSDRLGSLMAGGLSGLVGNVLPFADGAPFSQGRVMPFARGGVVSQATAFPMRGATGLMGEAGPEAILPLSRGPDGRLGVRSAGGGARPVAVTIHVTTPDAASFRRSQSQIAAEMARALGRGARNR